MRTTKQKVRLKLLNGNISISNGFWEIYLTESGIMFVIKANNRKNCSNFTRRKQNKSFLKIIRTKLTYPRRMSLYSLVYDSNVETNTKTSYEWQ